MINNVYQTSVKDFAVHNMLVSKSDSIEQYHMVSMYGYCAAFSGHTKYWFVWI